jgi:hypothetical protein
VGGVTPPLDIPAAWDTAQARGKAGVTGPRLDTWAASPLHQAARIATVAGTVLRYAIANYLQLE